jgi:hypothetical protein
MYYLHVFEEELYGDAMSPLMSLRRVRGGILQQKRSKMSNVQVDDAKFA